jgi:Rad3-related DNA helicase
MADLMDQMNMVEILSEELGEKELRIMKLETDLSNTKNRMKIFMKKNMMGILITCNDFIDEGLSIDPEDRVIWDEILTELNDSNWNGDHYCSELYINDDTIWFRHKSCQECDNYATHATLILQPDKTHYLCKICINEEATRIDNGLYAAEQQIEALLNE